MAAKILFVIAEMAPLIKIGGLADVGAALPRALREIGLDVRVAMPLYGSIDRSHVVAKAELPGSRALWETDVRGVPVYLLEDDGAFGREEAYGYEDDNERFLAFCDGLLEAAGPLNWRPDVLHLNDWHPGLLATRLMANGEHPWASCARVCTIHNLAFTGGFDAAFAREHGLRVEDEAFYSSLSQSIAHADVITTVSPTYAQEITTPDKGGDLAELLAARRGRLHGILNGLDQDAFDPMTDEYLAARFDAGDLNRRRANKTALQRQLGLPEDESIPIVGVVSRLFWQKGMDLAAQAIDELLQRRRLHFVALGQGDEEHERVLLALAKRHPKHVRVKIAFDAPLGQLIYGGCDLFLMPSRYEPGGLGQLIAMRYGAVPVVRRTGGLADTVTEFRASDDSGTGFLFDNATTEAVSEALEAALIAYQDEGSWRRLQERAMGQDFSWQATAREYGALYDEALKLKRADAVRAPNG
ncbi:MAG: glycogen synthase [Chloroflexi bacterium]|nr:glycogen synthase [Chloroflexota bacterium]